MQRFRIARALRKRGELFSCPPTFAGLSRLFSGSASSAALPPEKIDTEVLIVGSGPVGLSLSILLSQLGVRSVLVERKGQPTMHPQAHFINNRTMEIFQQMNGVASEIESTQPPLEEWRKFIYCHTMTGTILGEVDHFAEQTGRPEMSPTSVAHFSQNKLVPLLLKTAKELSLRQSRLQNLDEAEGMSHRGSVQTTKDDTVKGMGSIGHFIERYTCSKFETTKEHVVAHLLPSKDRQGAAASDEISNQRGLPQRSTDPTSVRSRYLIAADGASSGVRKQLGIKLEGDSSIESLISVHFTCNDLHTEVKDRQAMLYFVFNQEVIMVVVAHDLQQGEFVAQIPYYPPYQNAEEFTPQVCREMIQKAIGGKNHPIIVQSIRPWTMTAQVAERFSDNSNRVFLAGDAAHQFPPAGGFGMNTGIQDAHNLAWKLAAVLRGVSEESLLRTYEQERRPIAEANTALSVQNFKGAVAIPSALGLDPAAAKLLLRTLELPPISFLSASYKKQLLEQTLALGRAQMSPLLLNPSNPLGRSRLQEVARIIRDGESLQLQFPAEDLGFRYTQGAVWTGIPDAVERAEKARSVGRSIGYEADTRPGCRLPHCQLAVGRYDADRNAVIATKKSLSTLDLINGGRLSLRLLVTLDEGPVTWKRALSDMREILPFPMLGAIVWPQERAIHGERSENAEARSSLKAADEDLLHLVDVHNRWFITQGIIPGCVLLVRPDGHIAWRSTLAELRESADVGEGGVLQETFSLRTKHNQGFD